MDEDKYTRLMDEIRQHGRKALQSLSRSFFETLGLRDDDDNDDVRVNNKNNNRSLSASQYELVSKLTSNGARTTNSRCLRCPCACSPSRAAPPAHSKNDGARELLTVSGEFKLGAQPMLTYVVAPARHEDRMLEDREEERHDGRSDRNEEDGAVARRKRKKKNAKSSTGRRSRHVRVDCFVLVLSLVPGKLILLPSERLGDSLCSKYRAYEGPNENTTQRNLEKEFLLLCARAKTHELNDHLRHVLDEVGEQADPLHVLRRRAGPRLRNARGEGEPAEVHVKNVGLYVKCDVRFGLPP